MAPYGVQNCVVKSGCVGAFISDGGRLGRYRAEAGLGRVLQPTSEQGRPEASAGVRGCKGVRSACPVVASGVTNASQETLVLASKAYPAVVKGLVADGVPTDGFAWPEIWHDKLYYYSDIKGSAKHALSALSLWKTFKTGSAPLLSGITKYVSTYMRL